MNELKHLFLNTFVVEDRYHYFLYGLGITLLLTFSSFLLGTALGVVLCAGMRSESTAVRRVAGIIKSFFVQLPTMVLLMILVYVIFGRSALPILVIVIVGLTLKAASYLAEIFDTVHFFRLAFLMVKLAVVVPSKLPAPLSVTVAVPAFLLSE